MLINTKINTCYNRLFFIGILWSFFCSTIYGQPLNNDFHEANSTHGLSAEYNWFIYRDSRDLVWVSSDNGLFKYDGLNFRHYKAQQGKDNSIFDKNIQSDFFETSNGDLWFSTQGAINCYRRTKDDFDFFQVTYDTNVITAGYRVFHLESNSGKLWLKADSLLFWFQTKSSPTQANSFCISDSSTNGYSFAVDTTLSGEVKQIYSFPFSKPGLEVFSIDSSANWVVEKYLSDRTPKIKVYNGLIQNDSLLWLFTNRGLLPFDRKKNTLSNSLKVKNQAGLILIKGIFFDKKHLLLTSKDRGLWLFDTESLELTPYQKHFDKNLDEPNSNKFDALYLDKEERLWTSKSDKRIQHSKKNTPGKKFSNPINKYYEKALEASFILEHNKAIWVASNNQGTDIFNLEEERINSYPFDQDSFQVYAPRGLSLGQTGKVWCWGLHELYYFENGTWNLAIQSGEYQFLQLFQLGASRQLMLTDKGVFDLVYDSTKYELTVSEEAFFDKKIPFSFTKIFEGVNKQVIIPYQDKELWIGKLNEKESIEIDSIIPFLGRIYSSSISEVTGTTWLGTSKGLVQLESDGSLKYPLKNLLQFQANVVMGVQQADSGELFLSTDKGLYVYNHNYLHLTYYDTRDGLSDNDFSDYAALKASDGKMWFGNKSGLTVFHPDSIQPYFDTPTPYIIQLLIDNVPFAGDTVIGEASRIVLDHRANRLAFDIKAIGYHFPESNGLYYQLHGFDDHKLSGNNGQPVTYTNIPPREEEYILEYSATNRNGIESKSKFLRIYIEPPLIQKRWFQLLLLVLTLSLIYAFYRNRVYHIRKEARYKQMIAETETAILRLQMNPHFIFNSMNAINSFILKQDADTASDYLGRFAKLMRMILDFAAKPLIEVRDDVELLTLYLQTETIRFENRFDYSIEYKADFDPDEYLIPPMVLQPFVENAILHAFNGKTEKGQIKIQFWEADNSLFCSVEDDGIGRAAAVQQNEQIKTHESKALAITKRRMELLEQKDGVVSSIEFIDLFDKNKKPLGTRVLLRFPVF